MSRTEVKLLFIGVIKQNETENPSNSNTVFDGYVRGHYIRILVVYVITETIRFDFINIISIKHVNFLYEVVIYYASFVSVLMSVCPTDLYNGVLRISSNHTLMKMMKRGCR